MLDGKSTTMDWQRDSTQICVLAVGSFEQHGEHLPLQTDILLGEFFAHMVADDLRAALLPALPIGTCAEHSGFRGSISLRPETLMQIIRDIADEVQKQGFTILVIVNGHGGNFALSPVVRDINRGDRTLKIIEIAPWEFLGRLPTLSQKPGFTEIHAGENETSIMLAMHPELVREPRLDRPSPTGEDFPLLQRDLNSFGTGHFNPSGPIGYPTLATAERGRAIIASIKERMLPHVRDRIRRLREQPRYSGAGGFALRTLSGDDVKSAMRLKALAGWNQTEEDWRIFLANPESSFAAVHQGGVVGTATTIRYGDLAWIGMVLVDPALRRVGIGTMLLKRVIDHLQGCASIKLDATPAGREVYRKLGFVDDCKITRMTLACAPRLAVGRAQTCADAHMTNLLALDRSGFGADRSALLQSLLKNRPQSALVVTDGAHLRGFVLARAGSDFNYLGPIVAQSVADARELATAAMRAASGKPVMIDVFDAQTEFLNWLRDLGFSEQRSFIRMHLGKNISGDPGRQFAIAGPEYG
jgi:creatinine amidohydrolase/Fe(II)-dependent formamide hydrolase-like protein/ribosomal protein S18 acetylase RimI-like enzyme